MSRELCKRLADTDTMVGVKQGSFIREETLAMRRDIRDDFVICEPVLPPVRPAAAERAEWLVSKLKELGVA